MFSLERFKDLKANVKTRNEFSGFLVELKKTGIDYYEGFLEDGHADYYSKDGIKVTTARQYFGTQIANVSDEKLLENSIELFKKNEIDYLTFCNCCAKSGVEKWVISLEEMSCSYYSKSGKVVLAEIIPIPVYLNKEI